jgi:DNA-binding GntR family transcriptional regulator
MLNTRTNSHTARNSNRAGVAASDALRRLQFEGFETFPHSGDSPSASIKAILDVYATRGLLEEQAARLAARHIGVSEGRALERLAASMDAAVHERDWDTVIDLNRQLHFVIYRAAERPHLLRLIEQSWEASARYAALLPCATALKSRDALFVIRSLVAACKLKDATAMGLLIRYENHQVAAAVLEREGSNGPAAAR